MNRPPEARRSDPIPGDERWLRRGLASASVALLVVGIWVGLSRSGLGSAGPVSVVLHGPLMVSGFLGVLIPLERAIGLRSRLAYLAPATVLLSFLILLVRGPGPTGYAIVAAGSSSAVLLFLEMIRRWDGLHHRVMLLGAACWLSGNLLLAVGEGIQAALPWWLVFPVLVIAGERLELSRVRGLGPLDRGTFVASVLVLISGTALVSARLQGGPAVMGAGLVFLSGWLIYYDVATRGVQKRGRFRFLGLSMLLGYGWLLVGGLVMIRYGLPPAGLVYDAILHAVFVGFVFSMIFGHALHIGPMVTGLDLDFHPSLHGGLVLLHGSLVIRVIADLWGSVEGRLWGASLNALAIVIYGAALLGVTIVGRSSSP